MYQKLSNYHGREKKKKKSRFDSKVINDGFYQVSRLIINSPISSNSNLQCSEKMKKEGPKKICPEKVSNVIKFPNYENDELQNNIDKSKVKSKVNTEVIVNQPIIIQKKINSNPSNIIKNSKDEELQNFEMNMNLFKVNL